MASTPEATALSEQHRQRQLALRAVVVRQLLALWPAFDIADIDASWERIEPVILTLMAQGRQLSSALATVYFREFRAAEEVSGVAPSLAPLDDAWATAAAVSLRVTGPVTAKQLVAANTPQPAEVAFVRLSGAASRIVLNGGRDSLTSLVRRDRRALGYARVTSGDPCAFCAMLASRGPVYSKSGGDFEAHDHCGCGLEPVFSRDTAWPGRGRDFQALYRSATAEAGTKEKAIAFRRAYEGR